MYTHFGIKPIGMPVSSSFQLNTPVIICCETPAMMNKPTPEPIPHFETISSMYRTSSPPMNIWMNNTSMMTFVPTPRVAANTSSGLINPPKSWGRASSAIIINTRNFCAPWNSACWCGSLKSILMIFAPTRSCSTIDAVTIGPIPSNRIEPDAPAKNAR
ncbi:MAG: hypothetical protein FFODKBPE_00501 [Candidatus Argoarchaeum ethanivorans]|uniref:Uncharacterized protein n=1 Tax=Candidatus Argoarchaeum ethanivorans TaxID=2608793 RepID=A0A811TCG3_9EURY|nr:MAG: hypothetical protein FFODKBPE_00501 [Candidatus Argoarchaeum ethanivorans]